MSDDGLPAIPADGERAAAGPAADLRTLEAAERWFVRHGLPYFVDSERERARHGMRPARVLTVVGLAVALGLAAGALVGWFDPSLGVGTFMVTAGTVVGLYAATTLRMTAMARWAGP